MKFSLQESGFILKFENVQLVDRSNPKLKSNGTLYLTTSHLVFLDSTTKQEIWIYYSLISLVDKQPLNISGSPLLIKCKHFLTCLFVISKERDCQTISSTLIQFSRPSKYRDLLCFKENEHLKFLRPITLNVGIFNHLESEYARMGVPNNYWKSTEININYEMCDTYPSILRVPASATDQLLQGSANFRSRGRLPVLSYLHPCGASITRCSQPLTGFNGRSIEDEQLIQLILFTNENSKSMYVVDTRPRINALTNKVQGKGYENENNYLNINFYFIGIENIHVMRSSQQKLVEYSEAGYTGSFLNGLDKTDWLKHIKAIIDTSLFIADAISLEKTSVLVHCSDGWDRTAQTCSFASLLLDPYYRSIHGFQILIEKEWLMFGHKFSHRCGHLYENENSLKETSPIFSQFLECVWQLTQQFPCAFEFNERLLIKLHEHVYSCQFGTFIANCEKERIELKIEEFTYSVWSYIQHKINDFINPLYVPNSIYASEVLRPDSRIQSLKFWRSLYNRFDSNMNPTEKEYDSLLMLKNNTLCLNEYSKLLEKRCAQLKSLIKKSNTADTTKNKSKNESEEFSNSESSDIESKVEKLEITNSDANDPLTQSAKQALAAKNSDIGNLTLEKLALDYNSIELLWKSSRKSCSCSETHDTSCSKINCCRCGEIYCEKCSEDGTYVSSQVSTKLVFICDKCLKRFSIK